MIKIKKRATALLLGTVTFFIALAMPYNTTRVYAVDVAFSWVVNESSNTILNWILLYLGISVAPEAISEGKVFDKTGQFALDFCNEFFGDTFEQWYVSNGFSEDINTFKREFNDILTQDFDAAKYVAGDVKSSVLDVLSSYLDSSDVYKEVNFNVDYKSILFNSVNEFYSFSCSSSAVREDGTNYSFDDDLTFQLLSGHCFPFVSVQYNVTGGFWEEHIYLISDSAFTLKVNNNFYNSSRYSKGNINGKFNSVSDMCYYYQFLPVHYFVNAIGNVSVSTSVPFAKLGKSVMTDVYKNSAGVLLKMIDKFLLGFTSLDLSIPGLSDGVNDWAYDLVGRPDAWDIDKPDVKPWDNVDSLPIPGDIAIPKEIPGVTDLPGILDGVVGGTIPWPDIIGIIKDLPVDPTPEPDTPTKPDPDPELPEIPAVLPQGVSDKLKDLSGKFPFCIPFDVVDCYKSFATKDNAEAPKWDIDFIIPGTNQQYHFSVDLSMFDKYIPIFRSGVLILFFIGLCLATRKLIGWQIDN